MSRTTEEQKLDQDTCALVRLGTQVKWGHWRGVVVDVGEAALGLLHVDFGATIGVRTVRASNLKLMKHAWRRDSPIGLAALRGNDAVTQRPRGPRGPHGREP